MSCRIIAFVDHEIGYRLLEKMIRNRTSFQFELVAAVTTEANGKMWWPGVTDLCRQGGIPLHKYVEPFTDCINYADIDWYFLLSWKHIIPSTLIKHPKLGVINLHYSLLPEYRGVYPVNWAIIDGKEKTGITYHLVTEKIDSGRIVCQRESQIQLSDTSRVLQLRLDDLAYELFDDMLYWAANSDLQQLAPLAPTEDRGAYKSGAEFIKSNELDLNREYRAGELINLLRGKTFLANSKNLYIIDPATGKRIYVSISFNTET